MTRTRIQRLLRWTIVVFAGLVTTLWLLDLCGILALPPAAQFWLNWPSFAVIAACWIALQLSRGRLGPELKKMFLGSGTSFKSSSNLGPLAQILIILGGLSLAAIYIYSRMKH